MTLRNCKLVPQRWCLSCRNLSWQWTDMDSSPLSTPSVSEVRTQINNPSTGNIPFTEVVHSTYALHKNWMLFLLFPYWGMVINWLVVSKIFFFHILGISSSQVTWTPWFFRGVGLNHQPVNHINPWIEIYIPIYPLQGFLCMTIPRSSHVTWPCYKGLVENAFSWCT